VIQRHLVTVAVLILGTVGRAPAGEPIESLAAKPLAARASQWRCLPTSRFICTANGCESGPPLVWVVIDYASKRYERCDAKGCDRYDLGSSAGGIYTTAWPNAGAFLKALNDGSEYTEVVTLGTTVHVQHGRCTPEE
jgi:hypothetical protein